jgi:hypothetical protein
MARLRWRPLVGWSALGTVIAVAFTLLNLAVTQDDLGHLVDTKPTSVAAPVLGRELGPEVLKDGGDHDGAFFYVQARQPFDLAGAAPFVDRPHYRLQRVGYPLAAWLLHPFGGGWGLLWTMFAVGVLSLFLGGVGAGALAQTWRGSSVPAVFFPAMVGSVLSLRISVADPLALALAVWAVVALARGRLALALLAGVAAALTREPILLVFVGVLVHRRDRPSLALVAVPAGAVAAWGIVVRLAVDNPGEYIAEFGLPFQGIWQSIRFWAEGYEPLGAIAFVIGAGVAVVALVRRGLRHPLSWVLVLQLVFLILLKVSVLAPERNASRAVMPMMVFAVVMLATPDAARLSPPHPVGRLPGPVPDPPAT